MAIKLEDNKFGDRTATSVINRNKKPTSPLIGQKFYDTAIKDDLKDVLQTKAKSVKIVADKFVNGRFKYDIVDDAGIFRIKPKTPADKKLALEIEYGTRGRYDENKKFIPGKKPEGIFQQINIAIK